MPRDRGATSGQGSAPPVQFEPLNAASTEPCISEGQVLLSKTFSNCLKKWQCWLFCPSATSCTKKRNSNHPQSTHRIITIYSITYAQEICLAAAFFVARLTSYSYCEVTGLEDLGQTGRTQRPRSLKGVQGWISDAALTETGDWTQVASRGGESLVANGDV